MFKKKIKSEANNYQIRTTASDILNRFNETSLVNKKKRKFSWQPILSFSCSFILLSSLIFIVNNYKGNGNNANNSNDSSNINNDTSSDIIYEIVETPFNKEHANIITLEVASSLDLIENHNTPLLTVLNRNFTDNIIEEKEFKDICNNFKDNYKILKKSLSHKNNYEYIIEQGEFLIEKTTYPYKVTLEDNKTLYYSSTMKVEKEYHKDHNDDKNHDKEDDKNHDKRKLKEHDRNGEMENYEGVLIINGNIHELSGIRRLNSENKKEEIDILIKLDNTTQVYIEQESERSEHSYSYSIIQNDIKIYNLEIDFEKDDIEMECFDNNKEYEYDIHINDDEYFIKYSYFNENKKYEGNMTLNIDVSTNEMIFEDSKNNLIYKIYQ